MAADKKDTVDWKVINIDDYKIFNNPFKDIEPREDSLHLYEKYLSCKANSDILRKVGDNVLVSLDDSRAAVTREEVLQKVACRNQIRSTPTVVYRDVLNNTSGIIVQQVNCDGPKMGGKLAEAISLRYNEVEPIYRNLKVKTPGSIQMINIIKDDKHPLWLCNLFGKINTCNAEEIFDNISSKKKHFLKSGFVKLRVYMRKNKLQNLPIYIPYNMGEFQGWSWDDYEPVIMRYIPDAVICRL